MSSRKRSSNRPGVIAAPITEETFMSSKSIAGVRFSDQLHALLEHAVACGWRVERDERGRTSKGVLVLSPDKTVAPITIDERHAKFNRPHYENVKRELYQAGLPQLPTDVAAVGKVDASVLAQSGPVGLIAASSKEEALKLLPPGSRAQRVTAVPDDVEDVQAILSDVAQAPQFISGMIDNLAQAAGIGHAEASLIATLSQTAIEWALVNSPDRLAVTAEALRVEVAATYESQINEALALASEAEARATGAERDRERALERERKARDDCKAALRRADDAEARARELEGAIAPLRKILGQDVSA